ncbi:Ankyrin repeat-containing protein [Musa troglodytarum]|uniref:Ankyrin repeat-containing protein n=1 Tax=Musa troglodytarum TaxID=320322 RepID=A0A9E7G3C1_9LILI|nr:Ankyrin repeat-containing protein [Musa troglodytarum]
MANPLSSWPLSPGHSCDSRSSGGGGGATRGGWRSRSKKVPPFVTPPTLISIPSLICSSFGLAEEKDLESGATSLDANSPTTSLVLSNSGKRMDLATSPKTAPVLVLSNSGKRIDPSRKKKYVKQVTGRHNDTELHLAAQRGDLAAVRQILDQIDAQVTETAAGGADFDTEVAEIRAAVVNEVNEVEETPLFIAADKGFLDIVVELLKYSDQDSLCRKNRSGFDALHVAAREGHQVARSDNDLRLGTGVPSAEFLKELGFYLVSSINLAEVVLVARSDNDLGLGTGVPSAEFLKELGFCLVLLDHDPTLIKTFGPSNATPLISAAIRGHTEVVNLLLDRDASLIELSKTNGKNGLHFAARQGHVEIVTALLEKDPQLARRTDKKGQTTLHMAVKGTSCEVVNALVDADPAIVMLPDRAGNTALHVATRKKRAEIVKVLLHLRDTNVNALTRDHKTALDIAESLPLSEESAEIKEWLARYDAVRANELNQPRDELRKTVTEIKKDVHTQLEQTRKTNKNVHGIAKELRKLHREGINNATNSVTVVAVLFATVAFAAIFTVPGGTEDNGTAIVVRSGSFKIFFIFNAVALFTSLSVVVVQITLVRGETKAERRVVEVINKLMWLASVCTTVSFIASSYIVLGRHNQWAAFLVSAIGGVIMTGVLGTMTFYVVRSKRTRSIRKRAKSLKSGTSSWHHNSELSDSEVDRIYAI